MVIRLNCVGELFRVVLGVFKRVTTVQQYQRLLLAGSFVITLAVIGLTVVWIQVPETSIKPQYYALQAPSRLLPHKLWKHRQLHPENYNQISCSNFPRLEDIDSAAASWQHLTVVNGSVFLYGAYWDDRFDEPLVRVLVYCDVTPLPDLMCQFWYENENAPATVPSVAQYAWSESWGGPVDGVNEPYLLTCRVRAHLPNNLRTPAAVSIVQEHQLCGTPSNVLNVQGAPVFGKNITPLASLGKISVTLKWLDFRDDISVKLVEWIEMIKVLGATKLLVYNLQSHPNTRRVLDYYVSRGFADVTEYVHPPQLRVSPVAPSQQEFFDYRRELLPLNDCLYRSINKYQWMAAIDTDELIIPRRHNTWQKLIAEVTKGVTGRDAVFFRHYYFLDKAQRDLAAPAYLRVLAHLWRDRDPKVPRNHNVKSFHNTSSVVTMHNHFPMSCAYGRCQCIEVNEDIARLHHYRWKCGGGLNECSDLNDTVRDDTINKWRHVIKDIHRVLKKLGIEPT